MIAIRPVESPEDALTYLRINLAAEEPDRARAAAFYRIFRDGVVPNLNFDQEATSARRHEAVQGLPSVRVKVERGQARIEPETRDTREQI